MGHCEMRTRYVRYETKWSIALGYNIRSERESLLEYFIFRIILYKTRSNWFQTSIKLRCNVGFFFYSKQVSSTPRANVFGEEGVNLNIIRPDGKCWSGEQASKLVQCDAASEEATVLESKMSKTYTNQPLERSGARVALPNGFESTHGRVVCFTCWRE